MNKLPLHSRDNEQIMEGNRSEKNEGIRETILRKAFAIYDTDQSGHIDAEELRQLLRDLRWPHDPGTLTRVLSWLDDDLNGTVCIDEFLKWHDMAFKVRVLSPKYGNTPWSSGAYEPQLTPHPPHDGGTRNLELAEVSAKLGEMRQLAEQEEKGQRFGTSSPTKSALLGRPKFAQNPTGSLLETIDECPFERCEDVAIRSRSEGPIVSHSKNRKHASRMGWHSGLAMRLSHAKLQGKKEVDVSTSHPHSD